MSILVHDASSIIVTLFLFTRHAASEGRSVTKLQVSEAHN